MRYSARTWNWLWRSFCLRRSQPETTSNIYEKATLRTCGSLPVGRPTAQSRSDSQRDSSRRGRSWSACRLIARACRLVNNEGMRYLALLRGINVGGKNIIAMPDIRRIFEGLGFKNVTTYIQSGNVLFESKLKNAVKLSVTIEKALAAEFACTSPVVIVSKEQLESVVKNAPPAFGVDPTQYRYDVVFVRPPLRARAVLPTISLKAGVDEASEGNGVLYLKRLTIRASQSHLPKLTRNAAYKSMTIRNWNTTSELCRLISFSDGRRLHGPVL